MKEMRESACQPRKLANRHTGTRKKSASVKRRRQRPVTLADLPVVTEPTLSAEAAGLVYVDDDGPGIHRRRAGRGFTYVSADGHPIKSAERARLEALRVPPAWTDVWLCPLANGHIQATGRDERGRKQYRYHPRFHAVRDETKYHRVIAFGHALSTIRERVERALALPGLPREKVLATVVRLLDWTHIRVGNDEYTRENGSFGLTTMQDRHVKVEGDTLRFHFRSKHGKERRVDVRDARLAKVVRRCHDLPGHELFRYVDDDGSLVRIHSGDVNDYLREISGQDFTAKDFRTWAGSVLAARELLALGACDTTTQAKHNIVTAIDSVARHLGNTRTICKNSYVHPALLDAYTEGSLVGALSEDVEAEARMAEEELRLLAFLEAHLP
ncbi:DNA topoisomerase IB (poxvirus type) [Minicystis rosea]|nr:DNA topoisomerase IB (poxvirus type) [Minicystis rosea]